MERYSRQTMLPEIGEAGQLKLKAAKVLIVAWEDSVLPSPSICRRWSGYHRLADDDEVSLSNLQRQILYTEEEVGDLKAICASMRISALNREIKVNACPGRLSKENARDLIGQYDIIVDGCDNFATRYLLSDVCSELGKPYVYGAICGFEGQVSVFNYGEGTQRKTYRDLYPDEEGMLHMPPPPKGVVGVTPAVTGSVEACEVLKIICGFGEVLAGKLWTIDLRTLQSNIFSL